MRAAITVLIVLAAMAGPAAAGDFAACDPPRTVADAVAAADQVLEVRAVARTQRTRDDGLVTRMAVVATLHGAAVAGRIRLTDCAHWKCAGRRWHRGERAIVFVRAVGRGRFAVMGPPCRGGFTASVVAIDDPVVADIRAAAAP